VKYKQINSTFCVIVVKGRPRRGIEEKAKERTSKDALSYSYDHVLVQRLLQHSSATVTQRYMGIEQQRIERVIEGYTELI